MRGTTKPTRTYRTYRHDASNWRYFRGMTAAARSDDTRVRVGHAAEMLGVSVETLRRWEQEGRLRMDRSDGGQRLVPIEEITRLLSERRRQSSDRPIVAQSA